MESNFWGIVAWLIIPPAASLMFAGRLKGRSVLGALPYPWFLPKFLYWCLVPGAEYRFSPYTRG